MKLVTWSGRLCLGFGVGVVAVAPTGVTVGIWNRQGTMDEEFFFWDNQTFYAKMGLA